MKFCTDILAIESSGVLSLGLLAMAVLSFFLALAGLGGMWRFRPTRLPVASRRAGLRAWFMLLLIVLVNLAGLPALALYAHNAAQSPQGSELVQVGVLGAILVIILITNFLGAATQRRLGQLRVAGTEHDPQFARKLARAPRVTVFLRENLIPGAALLAIAILIWYLIDKQLSDAVTLPVEIRIDRVARGITEDWRWIIEDQPTTMQVRFVGPKDQIAALRNAKSVVGVLQYTLETVEAATIPVSRPFSELRFVVDEKPLGESVSTASLSGGDVNFKLIRNRDAQQMRISVEWVLEAMIERPDNRTPSVLFTLPPEVFLVYPVQRDPIVRLWFKEYPLSHLSSRMDEETEIPLEIRFDDPQLEVFSDRELTQPLKVVRARIRFRDTPRPVRVHIDNVPVTVRLPSRLAERGIKVELPEKVKPVDIDAPRSMAESLTEADLELVLVINESAIDWRKLEEAGVLAVPDCRYQLGGRGLRELPAGVTLVDPRPDTSVAVTLRR